MNIIVLFEIGRTYPPSGRREPASKWCYGRELAKLARPEGFCIAVVKSIQFLAVMLLDESPL